MHARRGRVLVVWRDTDGISSATLNAGFAANSHRYGPSSATRWPTHEWKARSRSIGSLKRKHPTRRSIGSKSGELPVDEFDRLLAASRRSAMAVPRLQPAGSCRGRYLSGASSR